MNPLVSIIIPAYNRAHLIGETLASVQAQTYPHWECIVVDDGSTDTTEELMKDWLKDGRFRFYKRHREPKGAPTCRNIGLDRAEGKYVIFLDSDDLLADFCLGRRVEKFGENKECDFLVFQSIIFEKRIDDLNKYFNVETSETDLNRFLRTESLWAISGTIYKRKVFDSYQFKEDYPFWQDVFLGVQMIVNNVRYKKFLNISPDLFIRISSGSVSRDEGFSKTNNLLAKRIDILLSFKAQADLMGYRLSKKELDTLYNFLYILCSKFVSDFYDLRKFNSYWNKIRINFKTSKLNWLLALLYQYVTYLRKFSIYSIKIRSVYFRLFSGRLPDMNELEKCKLHSEILNSELIEV